MLKAVCFGIPNAIQPNPGCLSMSTADPGVLSAGGAYQAGSRIGSIEFPIGGSSGTDGSISERTRESLAMRLSSSFAVSENLVDANRNSTWILSLLTFGPEFLLSRCCSGPYREQRQRK